MVIIRKKIFSKKEKESSNDDRTKKDKSWDSVYGAGVGGAAGMIGSSAIYKKTKSLRENTQDILDEINDKYGEKALKIGDRTTIIDEADGPGMWVKERNDAELHNINNNSRKKAIKRVKIKKGLAQAGIVSLPVLGSVLGSLYGRDNDLRRQRKKMEDAAGDKVASTIKNLGSGKEKKN